MEDLNSVPSTGTFGNSIGQVNQNFGLVKGAIENLEGRTIRSKGLFPTQAALTAAYPSPKVGDYAYVGSGLPATIYDCLVEGTWHNTGQTGGSETIDLGAYSTTAQMNTAIDNGLQGQVGYAVCNSNGSDRKDVVVNGFKLLASGGALHIKMTNANTAANATMNISPTSTIVSANTKPLFYNGAQASPTNTWAANEIISVYYDGTNYQATNSQGGGGKAEKIKYDNSQSGLASENVQGALDELESNIYDSTVYKNEMFDIDRNNVGTNASSYITIAKTDTGFTVNCVQTGSGKYVYCSILGLSVGTTYKLSFDYQYSNIGNVSYPVNFCIRNKANTSGTYLKGWTLGRMATPGTINDTFTTTTTSLYFVLANADLGRAGATVNISNISFYTETSIKDKISLTDEEIEGLSDEVDSLQEVLGDIDTSSLPVSKSPSSSTNISIDNTASNEYTITNTSKTAQTYAMIRIPVLSVGQKYKLRFKYTCNSSGVNTFGFATSSLGWSSPNLSGDKQTLNGSATDLQYEAVFTYATSQYYLRFYSNNMISGAVLVLKNFEIIPVDSFEDAINRIESLEENGSVPTDYSSTYVGTQIDLGKKTNYYKMTSVFSSVVGGQGMAMFGNYIFRTQNGGNCYLYETDGTTATQLWNSSVANGGHSNSAQFSPMVESGNDFPYLYISLCANPRQGCKVCKVTTEGIEVVQTIMLDNSEAFGGGTNVNVQVGDDGYLYVFGLSFKIWKVRLPSISEGDVTLTANDIIESFSVNLPYSTYPWQGGIINNGKLFVPTGFTSGSRFIAVIDLSSHVITNKIDITSVITAEPEDCDIINSFLYMAVNNSGMYKFDFL